MVWPRKMCCIKRNRVRSFDPPSLSMIEQDREVIEQNGRIAALRDNDLDLRSTKLCGCAKRIAGAAQNHADAKDLDDGLKTHWTLLLFVEKS